MVKQSPPVFLFIGNDSYLKEKAVKDLISSLPGTSSKDLDHKVFYGGEASQNEVLDHINAMPFLASRRLVVIKDLEKTSAEFMASLMNYMKNPSRSTCLVLEASGDSILKEYAEISKYASVKRFGELSGREVAAWINDFLTAMKKKMDADAAALLREMYGHNLLALTQELEKLAAFVGKRAEIKAGDVEEVVGKSLIASTFDLADAIGAKKTEKALRICRELLSAGKKEFEIIGLLCWHFKRLLKAKTLQSRGESDNRIASGLRIGQKYWAGFFKQVSGLGIGQIKAGIRSLLEADLDIKRTRFDYTRSNLVLEFAIIKLSQISIK
jgi:DNA polymerase-3 subunit delta